MELKSTTNGLFMQGSMQARKGTFIITSVLQVQRVARKAILYNKLDRDRTELTQLNLIKVEASSDSSYRGIYRAEKHCGTP